MTALRYPYYLVVVGDAPMGGSAIAAAIGELGVRQGVVVVDAAADATPAGIPWDLSATREVLEGRNPFPSTSDDPWVVRGYGSAAFVHKPDTRKVHQARDRVPNGASSRWWNGRCRK